jgi:hypothetical protein
VKPRFFSPIAAYWSLRPEPGNCGDMLTPLILNELGIRHVWRKPGMATVIACGSIIGGAHELMTVVGSGAMSAEDNPSPFAQYLAVRGPLTREMVIARGGECPEVYGDPALLLPQLFPITPVRRFPIGLVPHYVDFEAVARNAPCDRVINILRADPLAVIRDICECGAILSSSLHGIIIAHAYGIPAAWMQWNSRLDGHPDHFKFHDYAASVGIELKPYTRIGDAVPVLPAKLPNLDRLRGAFLTLKQTW